MKFKVYKIIYQNLIFTLLIFNLVACNKIDSSYQSNGFNNSKIQNLLIKYGAASYDKQMIFDDHIGKYDWEFLMDKGQITFDNRICYSVQVLGTLSKLSNTWLWGWANEQSDIPESLLKSAYYIKEYGENNAISEFKSRKLNVDSKLNEHIFALIASGICDSKAYYIGDHDNGSVVFLINDDKYQINTEKPLGLRITDVFTQFISQVEVSNHFEALKHYLKYLNLDITEGTDSIVARKDGHVIVTAEFSDKKLLKDIRSDLDKGKNK